MTYRKQEVMDYTELHCPTYIISVDSFPKCKIKDLNSKPKVIKKQLLNNFNLESNSWTIDAEIILQSLKRKVIISQIPTQFLGQPGGRDSFVGYKAILNL